jgi:hypothetical protein
VSDLYSLLCSYYDDSFFAYSVLCSSYYYDVFCAYERHVVGLELDQ